MAAFSQRASGYGIPGVKIDGNDVLQVYQTAKEAVERARNGEGPSLIECDTYRFRGHHEGDEQSYRTKDEVAQMRMHNDCIMRLKGHLQERHGWSEEEEQELLRQVEQEIADAVKFAQSSPPMGVEDMEQNLFAQ